MKINLLSFLEGQVREVEHTLDPAQLDISFIDFKYVEPIQLTGTLEKTTDVLTFRGILTSILEQMCGRCLEIKRTKIEKSFDLFYDIKNLVEIETIDDLREILIIDHPLSYVCSDQCRGLCAQCGENLNHSACKCSLTNRPETLSSWQLAWKKRSGGKGNGKS